jgi:hypothetical protein
MVARLLFFPFEIRLNLTTALDCTARTQFPIAYHIPAIEDRRFSSPDFSPALFEKLHCSTYKAAFFTPTISEITFALYIEVILIKFYSHYFFFLL